MWENKMLGFFSWETATVGFQGYSGTYVFLSQLWKLMPFTLSTLTIQSYSPNLFLILHSALQLFIGSDTAASEPAIGM